MHLLLAAIQEDEGPALAADPEVKGGGRFRLDLSTWHLDAQALSRWVSEANRAIGQDHRIDRVFVPRDAAEHRLDAQRFQDEGACYPGPKGSLQAIEIETVCTYPCDGTHADRTSEVGTLVIRDTHLHDEGRLVLVGEVPRQAP